MKCFTPLIPACYWYCRVTETTSESHRENKPQRWLTHLSFLFKAIFPSTLQQRYHHLPILQKGSGPNPDWSGLVWPAPSPHGGTLQLRFSCALLPVLNQQTSHPLKLCVSLLFLFHRKPIPICALHYAVLASGTFHSLFPPWKSSWQLSSSINETILLPASIKIGKETGINLAWRCAVCLVVDMRRNLWLHSKSEFYLAFLACNLWQWWPHCGDHSARDSGWRRWNSQSKVKDNETQVSIK